MPTRALPHLQRGHSLTNPSWAENNLKWTTPFTHATHQTPQPGLAHPQRAQNTTSKTRKQTRKHCGPQHSADQGRDLDPCQVVTGCPAPAEGITGHRQPCEGSNFRIRSTGLENAGRLGTTTGWAKGPRAEPPRAGTGVLAPAQGSRRRARPTETEEMGPSASETRDV